jgi:hypothetical protein
MSPSCLPLVGTGEGTRPDRRPTIARLHHDASTARAPDASTLRYPPGYPQPGRRCPIVCDATDQILSSISPGYCRHCRSSRRYRFKRQILESSRNGAVARAGPDRVLRTNPDANQKIVRVNLIHSSVGKRSHCRARSIKTCSTWRNGIFFSSNSRQAVQDPLRRANANHPPVGRPARTVRRRCSGARPRPGC